ncbi:MAG: hypothetical protein HZA19_02540 [Nitrospirae bacterium]|nr:hypothetical protein [Nitrospirota bacterium]
MGRSLRMMIGIFAVLCAFSAPAAAVSLEKFQLNGYFDMEYEKADKAVGTVSDPHGSFDQYHLSFLMELPVSDTLTIKTNIGYLHGPRFSPTLAKGFIIMEWAYAEYVINNDLRLRGGVFLTPFGLYNEIHDASVVFQSVRLPYGIYRAETVGGYNMIPVISTGISLLGSHFITGYPLQLTYNAYVTNGQNFTNNEAEKDDNSNKAVGVQWAVSPVSGLAIGGSYFHQKKQIAAAVQVAHTAWVVSADYVSLPVSLRSEYAASTLDGVTETSWYGEGAYAFGKIAPYLRYGILDPDDDQENDLWTEWVYGIRYQIQPDFFWKVEHRLIGGSSNNASVNQDYSEFATAISVGF